jgi:hypothetical protein
MVFGFLKIKEWLLVELFVQFHVVERECAGCFDHACVFFPFRRAKPPIEASPFLETQFA